VKSLNLAAAEGSCVTPACLGDSTEPQNMEKSQGAMNLEKQQKRAKNAQETRASERDSERSKAKEAKEAAESYMRMVSVISCNPNTKQSLRQARFEDRG